MPGKTDSQKQKQGEYSRRYPLDPARLKAFHESGKRLVSGIVDNLNNDFKDNGTIPRLLEVEMSEFKTGWKNEATPQKKAIAEVQRLNRAVEEAAIAHKKQCRKGTETPYISHPYAVGLLLARAGCSDDVIIAGILHDTVEDTSLTIDDIQEKFGDNVADIVVGCSEHDKEQEWKVRKQHTIDHLAFVSKEVKLVTCADKLHNVTSMLTDYAVHGETLWSRFNEGPYEQEWYYNKLVNVLTKGELKKHPLVIKFRRTVKELFVTRERIMMKAEFVAAVAAELDVPKTVAAESVYAFLKVTTDLLKAGDKVTFPGFGTFEVSHRAARKGRNPQTGAELNIAASKSGKFSAGKGLKNL
jgi:nucleoid DNA-binding protein